MSDALEAYPAPSDKPASAVATTRPQSIVANAANHNAAAEPNAEKASA